MDRIPVVTKNLLAINIIMFLATLVFEQKGMDLNSIFGLHLVMAEDFLPFQLVTYMFMHGDFMHLFFNMFALYMFGRVLEYVWGPNRFLIFFLLTGVGAAFIQEAVGLYRYYTLSSSMNAEEVGMVITHGHEALMNGKNFVFAKMAELNIVLNGVTVGASGAIFAILLGFGMLFPNEKMFIFPIPAPIKAKYFVIGYAVIELLLGASGSADGVAHFAHLGGMLFGLILILHWRKTNKIGGPYV